MSRRTKNLRAFVRGVSVLALALCALSSMACQSDSSRKGGAPKRGSALDPAGRFEEGAVAPDFSLTDVRGARVTLSEFRGKNVMLNFWATWCAPCVAEMPALERVHQLLGSKGLTLVSVNVDPEKGRKDVDDFLASNSISFPIALDPRFSVPNEFGVSGFPETIFIGPDGRVQKIFDLEQQAFTVRVMGDRPWDSPAYRAEIEKILLPVGNAEVTQ
ncbi:MAG: TlpA family protein disulfide reductase [Deltaproteobacteria bacterium]|nr:TlpA family protein disulfide reductase [Deltaproteobacteria bacterium]